MNKQPPFPNNEQWIITFTHENVSFALTSLGKTAYDAWRNSIGKYPGIPRVPMFGNCRFFF
jgi:hypothetical protein